MAAACSQCRLRSPCPVARDRGGRGGRSELRSGESGLGYRTAHHAHCPDERVHRVVLRCHLAHGGASCGGKRRLASSVAFNSKPCLAARCGALDFRGAACPVYFSSAAPLGGGRAGAARRVWYLGFLLPPPSGRKLLHHARPRRRAPCAKGVWKSGGVRGAGRKRGRNALTHKQYGDSGCVRYIRTHRFRVNLCEVCCLRGVRTTRRCPDISFSFPFFCRHGFSHQRLALAGCVW